MARYQRPALSIPAIDVWGAAAAAQRINGSYVKFIDAEDPNPKQINRAIVKELLADTTRITAEDRIAGEQVRSYYKGFTFKLLQGKALNEFDNAAMRIASQDQITSPYDIAVITSLPSCYERGAKRDQVNSRLDRASGGFIGSPGDKVTLEVEILRSTFSQQYNTCFVTGLTSKDQRVFFAYKQALERGLVKITGTVKAHRDNSTQLNRVKVSDAK